MSPRTLILRTAGTNCDLETAHAFELAGAATERVHVNQVLRQPALLRQYQILAFPGGFSYGDDIAAGKILANQLMHHLRDGLHEFVESGKPIIGICNGFQVLVKTDLLPGAASDQEGQTATLTNNDCGRFIDRWIRLSPQTTHCIWTRGLAEERPMRTLELPIAHGEGKFVPANESVRQAIWENRQVVFTYANERGQNAGGAFPDNPNGSVDDIAGVCDASGLVFGLMPHPERFVDATQHPAWTRQPDRRPDGIAMFKNAVDHARSGVGAGI